MEKKQSAADGKAQHTFPTTFNVIVDLAQENGAWVGSIIIPGLDVKGAPLTDIAAKAPDVSFSVKGTLGIQLKLQLDETARSGRYARPAPRQFHRVKWKFPTGDRVISSPVFKDNVIYFGGDDGNVYAVDAATGRQIWKRVTNGPVPATPAIADGTLYVGSYDGKFYAFNAQTGALEWKFATEGERRFEAKGLHGLQPKNQTIADPFDVFLSSPLVANGAVYFGSGDGNLYALDAATGDLRWKFKTGDACTLRQRPQMAFCFLEAGTAISMRWTRLPVKGEVAFSRRRRPAHSQPGGIPIFSGGRERRGVHRLPRCKFVCA